MQTEIKHYTIQELLDGFIYLDSEDRGLFGMNGKLVIQPEYQRNYIYGDGIKDVAVVNSVLKGWPIGILYFYSSDNDTYELLDGQQRLTSLGRFIQRCFTVNRDGEPMYFDNLPKETRDAFLNYQISVCVCEGTHSEMLDWFKILNTGGVILNEQEILNAVYFGPFISSLRKAFSNASSPRVTELYQKFIPGNPKRQDILAIALKWYTEFFDARYNSVQDLLATEQNNEVAVDSVTSHINSLTMWALTVFKGYDPLMKGVNWGGLFKQYCLTRYNSDQLKEDLTQLKEDPAVTRKSGIFEYLLSGKTDPRLLNIRLFNEQTRRTAYTAQTVQAHEDNTSNCPLCAQSDDEHRRTKIYDYKDMEADHITAWRNGGTSTTDNCQMLCKTCNRTKSYH